MVEMSHSVSNPMLVDSITVLVPVLQNVGVLKGAEGGEVDPRTPRKSSSSRSSRKSFRLDYRLEVKKTTLLLILLLSPKALSFST